eukprot:3322214-Prymnesium_polylepis.1
MARQDASMVRYCKAVPRYAVAGSGTAVRRNELHSPSASPAVTKRRARATASVEGSGGVAWSVNAGNGVGTPKIERYRYEDFGPAAVGVVPCTTAYR